MVDSTHLDYEANTQLVVSVTATDLAVPPLSDTKDVTVNLNNLNDAPQITSIGGLQFTENQVNVLQATATDQDQPGSLQPAMTPGILQVGEPGVYGPLLPDRRPLDGLLHRRRQDDRSADLPRQR